MLKMRFLKSWFSRFILIIIVITLIDQITKFLFQYKNFNIINGLLLVKYSENPGLIFGLFSDNVFFLYILPFIVIFLLLIYYLKEKRELIALSLIIGGILSNTIGRAIYGYVIDFIFVPIYPKYNISLFNLADACIVIGVVLLIWKGFRK